MGRGGEEEAVRGLLLGDFVRVIHFIKKVFRCAFSKSP